MGLVESEHGSLILTLQIDETSQRFFDECRERYFPPAINYLSAHITLFHHLPGEQREAIERELLQLAGQTAQFPVACTSIRSLGRGVAYQVESSVLQQLRNKLREQWLPWLTPQDRQTFRGHVTVQNKVSVDEARQTLALLQASFQPWAVRAEGLKLWRYLGGPWRHLRSLPFDVAGTGV